MTTCSATCVRPGKGTPAYQRIEKRHQRPHLMLRKVLIANVRLSIVCCQRLTSSHRAHRDPRIAGQWKV